MSDKLTRRQMLGRIGVGAVGVGAGVGILPKLLSAQGNSNNALVMQLGREYARLFTRIRESGPTRDAAAQLVTLHRTLAAFGETYGIDAAVRASVQRAVDQDGKDAYLDRPIDDTHTIHEVQRLFGIDITPAVHPLYEASRTFRAQTLDEFLAGEPLMAGMLRNHASLIESLAPRRLAIDNRNGGAVARPVQLDCNGAMEWWAFCYSMVVFWCYDPFAVIAIPDACAIWAAALATEELIILVMGC